MSPERLLAGIEQNRLTADARTPLVIQSFDEATISAGDGTAEGAARVAVEPAARGRVDAAAKLKEIASWATGIGPNKAIVAARPEVSRGRTRPA